MTKAAKWRLWLLIVFGLTALLALAEFYTRTTDEFSVALPDLTAANNMTLLFHGSHDADNPVFIEIRDSLRAKSAASSAVHYIDWSAGADNRARAASNARRLGAELASELAANQSLATLTLIAHSAGAFVPDALCVAYRATDGDAEIRMIFLDPFQLNGLLDRGYGARNHGTCADFALAIVNRTDPAPTTNTLLSKAYNIDVTDDLRALKIERNGHYWPPEYYLAELSELQERFEGATHNAFPRGVVERPRQ